jgi:glycosyltransferase involved in cell wall biosynthesis
MRHPASTKAALTPPEVFRRRRAELSPQNSCTIKPGKWRVIHACEYARNIIPMIEGQVAAGMRPYIVTPQDSGAAEFYLGNGDLQQPHKISLLRAWQDVRHWRKSLLECDPENTSDLVHTHSFASGMAGVRNLPCVVYDLNACIEEYACFAGLCERGSWMGRSFRVAEQFVLARAQAVVVHSSAMKSAVEERGAAPDNIFVIPDPLQMDYEDPSPPESFFSQEPFAPRDGTVTYFAPAVDFLKGREAPRGCASLLEALALVVLEIPRCRLLLEAAPESCETIRAHAERIGLGGRVFAISPEDASFAMWGADIVIASGLIPEEPVKACEPNYPCIQAMRMGKAILAADVPRNRDISPNGTGCLWYTEGDIPDLARRMSFLGSHPEFRKALSESGRAHIYESRSVAAVGRMYRTVYQHAAGRRKLGGPAQPIHAMQPLASGIG